MMVKLLGGYSMVWKFWVDQLVCRIVEVDSDGPS